MSAKSLNRKVNKLISEVVDDLQRKLCAAQENSSYYEGEYKRLHKFINQVFEVRVKPEHETNYRVGAVTLRVDTEALEIKDRTTFVLTLAQHLLELFERAKKSTHTELSEIR